MKTFANLAKIVAIVGTLTTALVGRNAAASDFLDVSGMKAIYDAETGSLRFEGLFNIHGVGIGRNDKASFRPAGAATTQASFAVANEEEAGWLFLDGIEGGSFDAGSIFPAGLSDGLSDFYIGVSSIGSGKSVTPIPIYSPSGVYLPNFDLYAPSSPIVETPRVVVPAVPVIPIEPVIVPIEPVIPSEPAAPANEYLDVSGMKAIYDADTGSLRFEGLFNIHGVGIGRNDKVEFRPEGAASTDASFSVANEEEAGWLFLDGIEGGSFDAGSIFPTGLSDGLSDFYIGVSSIGSGKNVTPIPIYSSSGVYLPNFDLYATPTPPVVETPPILDPVIPTIPVEPVLPSESELPPVVELPPPAEPSDPTSNEPPEWAVDPPATIPGMIEPPTTTVEVPVIDPPSIPVLINRPIYNSIDWGWSLQDYLPLRMAEYQNFTQLGLGANIASHRDLVDMDLSLAVDSLNHELSSIQLAILRLQQTASPLSVQLTGALTFADAAVQQVAVPEPAAGLVLLSGAVGGGAFVRRRDRREQQAH